MDSNNQISIKSVPQEIEHKFDPKTGMHSFTMTKQGLYYQKVLSAETFVYMTPDAMSNYFHTMKKHFDDFLYKQTKNPPWMGATHTYAVLDEMSIEKEKWNDWINDQKAKSKKDDIAVLALDLPGMNERVLCPDKNCENSDYAMTLYYMIQHVNDEHKWKREDIADWLETLDIDLSFKTPTEKKVEIL